MLHQIRTTNFQFYRYQILPISKEIQMTYAPHRVSSLEELLAKKNEFFAKALLETDVFKFSRSELNHRFVDSKNDIFVLQLGANRSLKRIKKDFTEEKIENWPYCLVVFNNNKNVQKVAIQQNIKVFTDTQTITKILAENLNKKLNASQLAVVFEPITEKKVFWGIVKENRNKVLIVDFELITPNLSNISTGLSEDLKFFQKETNTLRTNLKLQSDKTSSLDLSERNDTLKQLVDYASRGGGNIKIMVRGYKKYINTAKNIKRETIDEIEIANLTSDSAAKILPDIIKP